MTKPANIDPSSSLTALLFLGLLLGPQPAIAQTSLSDLSTCGLTCLVGGISRSNCTALDIACQCASDAVMATTTDCLLSNCTMQDSLDVSRFTASQCQLPHDSRSTQVIVVMSTLWVASLVFVVLRGVSKYLTHTFSAEDHIIVCSVAFSVVPMACVLYMAELGFGGHVYDLNDGTLQQILRIFYVAEIIYVVALALTKISIVFLYLRIFWAYRPFLIACYGALAFIIAPTIVITVLTIVSCYPIPYFWNRDIVGGTCRDVTALAYINSAFAMAQDVVLIVLPVFMLVRLQMSTKKKVFISVMFAVGSLGLIATIVRLRTLYVFGNLRDPPWDYVPVVYWTTTELAAGVICASLPAVRLLLERFFAVFKLTTHNRSQSSMGPRAGAIRMERRRRPTADGGALEEARWKHGDVWADDEDGISERGLAGAGRGMAIGKSSIPGEEQSRRNLPGFDFDLK